jgi:flagellar protein FliJ
MPEYIFRLQKLLDIRIDSEEQCKIKFKQIMDDINRIQIQIKNIKKISEQHANCVSSTLALKKMKYIYLDALASSICEATKVLEEKTTTAKEVRSELAQKQIERKTVEKLKENAIEKFNKEQNAKEQKTNDELALYAHFRNMKRR